MPALARHLRALVIAIAVLALSATVVLGAHGLPALTAALTGSGTTADANAGDAQGEDADDQGEDGDAPDEDADDQAEDGDAPDEDAAEDGDADGDAPEAAEEDVPEEDAPEADGDADNHGAMVSQAAGMETPDGFANHGAFVSCVARQNHGHLAPDATPTPIDQLNPEDCAKDADEDASDEDAAAPDAAPTSDKIRGKSASAHDKAPKSHGKGKGHGH